MKPRHRNHLIHGVNGFLGMHRVRSKEHVTVWVEGRDDDGPSVAGMALSREGLEQLVLRATGILKNWAPNDPAPVQLPERVLRGLRAALQHDSRPLDGRAKRNAQAASAWLDRCEE